MANINSTVNNNNWIPNPLDAFTLFWLDHLEFKNEEEAMENFENLSLEEKIRNKYEKIATELDLANKEFRQIPNNGSNAVSGNSIPNYFQVELCELYNDRVNFGRFLRKLRKSAKDYPKGTFAEVAKYLNVAEDQYIFSKDESKLIISNKNNSFKIIFPFNKIHILKKNIAVQKIKCVRYEARCKFVVKGTPFWNLARLCSRTKVESSKSMYTCFQKSERDGIVIYVIDSYFPKSLQDNHIEILGEIDEVDECNKDHGTHVTSIIQRLLNGVLKIKIKFIQLNLEEIMSEDKSISRVNVAFSLINEDIKTRKMLDNYTGSIVNCSWWVEKEHPAFQILNRSFESLHNAGVHIVTTSGNNPKGGDSNWLLRQKLHNKNMPACLDYAIKVGAIDENDAMATFSYANTSITCFAPGVNIQSLSSKGEELVLSGTSMACPHVAVLVAYFLSIIPDPKSFTPSQMIFLIKVLSSKNMMEGPDFLAEEFRNKVGYNVVSNRELSSESRKMIRAVHNIIIHNGVSKSKEEIRHLRLTANDYRDLDGLVFLSE